MSDKTEQWLSFESVAKIRHDTAENLEALVHESSPEKAFRERSLLFNRERYEADQPCLQWLKSESENKTESRSSTVQQSTEQSDRTYQLDSLPITVQLRWQPGQPRKVLITATSYDDFPIATLIDESDLGELPPVLNNLLESLHQDLPVRKLRYQQKQPKTQAKETPKQTSLPAKVPSNDSAVKPVQSTQISLF
ncbi:hypothetical protein ACKFKF_09820 [Phormidesmis sp. 146-12]